MTFRWLTEGEGAIVADAYGGKAARLSRIAPRFPVPPGFCLPASATGEDGVWGSSLRRDLRRYYDELSRLCGIPNVPVAVRSSGRAEDSAGLSFAGIHETALNVSGFESLIEATVRCRESSRTSRALAYRAARALTFEPVSLGVLIQQFVPTDVAAIVFSCDPMAVASREIVVTSTWGLGVSLADGLTMPDTFRVHSSNTAVIERRIATKHRAVVPGTVGTRVISLAQEVSVLPSLNDGQVIELATVTRALEREVDSPIDVECGYAEGRLCIFQWRPLVPSRVDAQRSPS
jgi:pyruvate,water dikinase